MRRQKREPRPCQDPDKGIAHRDGEADEDEQEEQGVAHLGQEPGLCIREPRPVSGRAGAKFGGQATRNAPQKASVAFPARFELTAPRLGK